LLTYKGFCTELNNKKLIGTTWLAGNSSCTLVIPKALAEEYGLDRPSNVVIQGRAEGILITKLKLESNDCPNCGAKTDVSKNRVNTDKTEIHKNGSGGLAAKQIPLDPEIDVLVCRRHDNPVGSTYLIGSEYHES
jgi:bifunctional DNA-binding transcriptional regulator/antitoxin component of YhaV-PrlF toxin-antitoxin module